MRKVFAGLAVIALLVVLGYALVRAFSDEASKGDEAVLSIATPTAMPGATEAPTQEAAPVGSGSGEATSGSNPLEDMKFYVDPLSNAKRQADQWRASRPDDAKAIDKIAVQPQADWMGEWSGNIETAVSARVKAAASKGSVPVLVAYNIPQRDCGNYSAGGVGSGEEYKAWIEGFARGIGANRAVVILEPDGLPLMDCLSPEDKERRMSLMSEAVDILKANAGTVVYIDAGHSHWDGAESIASRLKKAGVGKADGFSLNVSNYYSTDDVAKFGREVSGLVGGKHFVVDTSRNGLGPAEGKIRKGGATRPVAL